MSKIRYSAVVLTKNSRLTLINALAVQLEALRLAGWKFTNSPPPGVEPEQLPHHMTICMGPLKDASLKNMMTTSLLATHWGQNATAAAVKVKCDVASDNDTKHITCAVAPNGKPFHSNGISEWTPLAEPVMLYGLVTEVG